MRVELSWLVLFSAVIVLPGALGMGALWIRTRSAHLLSWFLGLACTVVGCVALAVRDWTHSEAFAVLANLLMSGAFLFYWQGVRQLYGRKSLWLLGTAVMGWAAFGLIWFTAVQPHVGARIVIVSAVTALFGLGMLRTLVQHFRRSRWHEQGLALTGALVVVVGMGVRSVLSLSVPAEIDNLSVLALQTALAVLIPLSSVWLAYGFATLHASQLVLKLQALNRTDGLSGLLNRAGGERQLARLFDRLNRPGAGAAAELSVMMLDIDHFKRINDTHGHAVGDEAIRFVGQHLLDHLRPNDSAIRFGGEEFVVVMPHTNSLQAHDAAQRLRSTPMVYGRDAQGKALTLTVSVGVTQCRPEDASWRDTLIRADGLLYDAKRLGRDRVVLG